VICSPTKRNLARLAAELRGGGIVGVPTETVYGLAANALDAAACRKIFRAKGRPARDPLIVHVARTAEVARVAEVNPSVRRLAARFWPGPLTVVLLKKPAIPGVVSAGLPSVAVRVPAHPLFRRLIRLAGVPLAAPSANRFGYISPTTAEHVRSGLRGRVRYILDGGPSAIGLESTIIDLRDERHPRLLRPGAITVSQLERVLGRRVPTHSSPLGNKSGNAAMIAPGMLKRHYSPRTPMVLHRRLSEASVRKSETTEAWVSLSGKRGAASGKRTRNYFSLSPRGDLHTAARRLFALLRELDDGRFRKIHIELARGGGLADAINDRLRRAASP
jgi:L-threonylcarbamoyladenylate synthase